MAYDTTALRLAAARNLGFTAGFMVATGRDFTGSVADYQALSMDQQQALGREMFAIVRAHPADYAPAQVAVASGGSYALFTSVPAILSPSAAALTGAGEGIVNLPENVGKAGVALVHSAGSIVRQAGAEIGGAVNATAGSLLGFKFSTLAWVAAGGVFLYFLANSPAGARAAVYTAERIAPVKRNPYRRRRARRFRHAV